MNYTKDLFEIEKLKSLSTEELELLVQSELRKGDKTAIGYASGKITQPHTYFNRIILKKEWNDNTFWEMFALKLKINLAPRLEWLTLEEIQGLKKRFMQLANKNIDYAAEQAKEKVLKKKLVA